MRSSRKNAIGGEFVGYAGLSMSEFLQDSVVQLVIWASVISVMVVVAVYVSLRIRTEPVQQEPVASEMLSKFRELRGQGDLSEEEFRTIKTTLAEQLQEELKDNEGKG